MKCFSTTGIYVHEQLQPGLRFCFLRNDSGVLRIANRILETRLYNLFSFEGPRLKNEVDLKFQLYTSIAPQLQMARAKGKQVIPVFAENTPPTVLIRWRHADNASTLAVNLRNLSMAH